MAEGIRILPADGGPYIDLTAGGVKCPSFVAYNTYSRPDSTDNKISHTFPINLYPGATGFTIPDTVCHVGMPISPNLLKKVNFLTGLSTDANGVHVNWEGNYVARQWDPVLCNLRTYQILPGQTQGFVDPNTGSRYGISLNDSTNFLEITDAAIVGQCIWKGTVTTPWSAPAIAGYDPNRYLIFAHWDNGGVAMDYDPASHTLRSVTNGGGYGNEQTVPISVEVVIFCDGVAPTPHNGGLNIFNDRNQCTFSTTHAPFLLKGFINSTGGAAPAGVSRMMVPVTRTGVYSNQNGGWYNYGYIGLTMSGNTLGTGRTIYAGSDTDHYGAVLNPPGRTVTFALPVIDAANYI